MSVNPEFPESYPSPEWALTGLPGGINNEGLTTLTPAQQEFCDFWYGEIEYNADPSMRPEDITAMNEYRFAKAVHRLVADRVSLTHRGARGSVVPREKVEKYLEHYYALFPATRELPLSTAINRRQYQDATLEITRQNTGSYDELEVVYALRRAFRDRQLFYPVRGMFGLLGAYGAALHHDPPTDELY